MCGSNSHTLYFLLLLLSRLYNHEMPKNDSKDGEEEEELDHAGSHTGGDGENE